jgi:signal transduction histidine kinase
VAAIQIAETAQSSRPLDELRSAEVPACRDPEQATGNPPDPPDTAEVARLQARLNRERLARREAERIAESSLRELYLHQEDLRVLESAARAANEEEDPRVVITRIVGDLCDYAGWPVGHALLREGDGVRSTGLWHDVDPERHRALREASVDITLLPGFGLPGRVLDTGRPVWAKDVATDETLPRVAAIAESGLASGFAFPVLTGSEVVAVLEFYSPSQEPPDQRVLDIAAQVAVQAGRALERRRAALELRRAQTGLEETLEEFARSNRDLEAFAYVASHDLQEPLRSMSSFMQLLARRYEGQFDERADEYIAFAVEATRRMQGLINDLLQYSRVGRRRLQRGPVDLGDVVAQAQQALAHAIAEADARIEVEPLPVVHADPSQLAQVIINLVANAVKFHRDHPPLVQVRAEREDAAWRVVVEDDGIGIPPEQAPRVFEMFKRLHAREEYPGTGIGLAICQKVVERHGGTLAVEPRPGGGSRFSFTIPDAGSGGSSPA